MNQLSLSLDVHKAFLFVNYIPKGGWCYKEAWAVEFFATARHPQNKAVHLVTFTFFSEKKISNTLY